MGKKVKELRDVMAKARRSVAVSPSLERAMLGKKKKICYCPEGDKGKHQSWCPYYKPSKAEQARVRKAEQAWERSLGIR